MNGCQRSTRFAARLGMLQRRPRLQISNALFGLLKSSLSSTRNSLSYCSWRLASLWILADSFSQSRLIEIQWSGPGSLAVIQVREKVRAQWMQKLVAEPGES